MFFFFFLGCHEKKWIIHIINSDSSFPFLTDVLSLGFYMQVVELCFINASDLLLWTVWELRHVLWFQMYRQHDITGTRAPSARKLDADWLVDELNPSGFGWCHILILCVWLSCSDHREPTGSRSLIHPSAARANTFSLASSSFSRLALPTLMAHSKLWKLLFPPPQKMWNCALQLCEPAGESDNHQWCSRRSGFSTR